MQAGVAGFDRRAIPADARETRWLAGDGAAIRRFDWAPAAGEGLRGSLLFLPGRGDAYEKYLESMAHWRARGWRVTSLDWRGQAGSGRAGFDPLTGHIGDFAHWITDLADFWAGWREEAPGPHIVIGHSMGGHLVLRALAERRIDPQAAVLSAPMLGFITPPVPLSLLHWAARGISAMGDPRRRAWAASEMPKAVPDLRSQLLTHDTARYDDETAWRTQRPELVMGPASWGWIVAALASMRGLAAPGALEVVTAPVLIIGTTADRLVDYRAIARAAARLPHAELITLGAEARHEVLREVDAVREPLLANIDAFLDRHAAGAA